MSSMSVMSAEATKRAAEPMMRSVMLWADAPRTIRVPMLAGPMQMGMASGTTLMSSSGLSGVWDSRCSPMRATEVRNRSAPAPMRKASSVKPNTLNSDSPKKYSTVPTMKTAVPVRRAVRRLRRPP